MVIVGPRPRRFRVTAVDKKTGDVVAYETNDRARARLKLAEFEGRKDLIEPDCEMVALDLS